MTARQTHVEMTRVGLSQLNHSAIGHGITKRLWINACSPQRGPTWSPKTTPWNPRTI